MKVKLTHKVLKENDVVVDDYFTIKVDDLIWQSIELSFDQLIELKKLIEKQLK